MADIYAEIKADHEVHRKLLETIAGSSTFQVDLKMSGKGAASR